MPGLARTAPSGQVLFRGGVERCRSFGSAASPGESMLPLEEEIIRPGNPWDVLKALVPGAAKNRLAALCDGGGGALRAL